ncbi:MAG: cephalosporin hydroxylase family protein [Gemmatimonas sp.]
MPALAPKTVPQPVADDRAQFESDKRAHAAGMVGDRDLADRALDVLIRSDQHNWSYQWSWLGVPIIQMPPDVIAVQEVLWETRPDIVVETGVARGGSLILYASILELIGKGRVVGIDIDIRPHNRDSIERHPLSRRIDLIEGSSIEGATLARLRKLIPRGASVMVILDSNHTHQHVLDELRLYGPLVTKGQFMIVADTVVERIPPQAHRPRPWGPGDNPATALDAYLKECARFERDAFMNAKLLISSSPGGYLRCVRD